MIVGGKPFNSIPAWVPVMFELTILIAGISTVVAMFLANGLPNRSKKSVDPSITCDRFAVMIEAPSKGSLDSQQATTFLQGIGAQDVRTVYAEGWF